MTITITGHYNNTEQVMPHGYKAKEKECWLKASHGYCAIVLGVFERLHLCCQGYIYIPKGTGGNCGVLFNFKRTILS